MLQTILIVVMILIGLAMTGVVLLQRSEGGALGMGGGGGNNFMTARGAGNLLTTLTWWLGGAFAACAIALTIVGNMERGSRSVLDVGTVGSIDVTAPQTTGQAAGEVPGQTAPAAPAGPTLDDLEASLPASQAPAE